MIVNVDCFRIWKEIEIYHESRGMIKFAQHITDLIFAKIM